MSFYVNNTELAEAYFNGSEVSSIYYNGTLVWESCPYIELDYIQSSGTQYIDTGFTPNQNTRIDMVATPLNIADAAAGAGFIPYGAAKAYNSQAFECYTVSGKFEFNYGTNYEATGTAVVGQQVTISHNKNAISVTTGGTTSTLSYSSTTFTAPYTMTLFAIHRSTTLCSGGMKLYSCQIYDNGTLVRDYIPVKMKSNSAIGLWDKVNNEFYANVGTGAFSEPTVFSWVGWSSATWEDVYNLCKAKQAGDIDAWPSDVTVGATKTTTLSTAVLGSSSVSMRVIGRDIDGNGVLTFHAVDTLANSINLTELTHSSANWSTATNFYNYCNAKAYIKQLSKITYPSGVETAVSAYVWLPSVMELDASEDSYTAYEENEFTSGVSAPYPYYTSATLRKKNQAYWLRSYKSGVCALVETDGTISSYMKSATGYIAPAFAIG